MITFNLFDSLLSFAPNAKLNPIVTLPSYFPALQTVFLFLLSVRLGTLTPFDLP